MLSTNILRYKESDRLNAIMVELTKLDAAVNVSDDGDTLTIVPARQLQPAAIDTYDDHRMAIAFGLLPWSNQESRSRTLAACRKHGRNSSLS